MDYWKHLFIHFQCFEKGDFDNFCHCSYFFYGGNTFLEVLTAPFLKWFPNWIILKWNKDSLFKEKSSVPSVSTHLPLLQMLLGVACTSSWWFWPQLTAASFLRSSPLFRLSSKTSKKHSWLWTLSSSWLSAGLSKLFSFCLSSYFSYYFLYFSSGIIFYSFGSFITGIPQDSILDSHLPICNHPSPNWEIAFLADDPTNISILTCKFFTFSSKNLSTDPQLLTEPSTGNLVTNNDNCF